MQRSSKPERGGRRVHRRDHPDHRRREEAAARSPSREAARRGAPTGCWPSAMETRFRGPRSTCSGGTSAACLRRTRRAISEWPIDTFLGRVPIPPRNVHRIQGERSPADAAGAYEAELRAFFPRDCPLPAFDCVILGAGADGHTASLFPGSWALDEANRWAVAVEAPDGVPCRHRVTLTLPAINASKTVLFLISGADKRFSLRDLCRDPAMPAATPAGRVSPGEELRVFADVAALGVGPGGTRP